MIRVFALLGIAVTALAALVGDDAPGHTEDSATSIRRRIADSFGLYWDLSVSGDGRLVAFVTMYGEPALFVMPTTGDSPPERLPVDEDWPREPELSPDGRYVIYRSRRTPSSDHEALYLFDRTSRESRLLAKQGPRADEQIAHYLTWSPDGTAIAYQRSWADGETTQSELRLLDVDGGSETTLFHRRDMHVQSPAFSPDGRRIAFLSPPGVSVLDTRSRTVRTLTAFGPDATFAPSSHAADPPAWSPDGTTLAVAVRTGQCHRIALVDVTSGERRWLDPTECAMRPVWFPGGDRIAYVRLATSQRTLWSRSLTGGPPELLAWPDGMAYKHAFDAEGDVLVIGQPSNAPRSVWKIDLDSPGSPEPIASPFDPPLPDRWISAPTTVQIESRDGLAIPTQVFPRTCRSARPGPAVVWVHGGPADDISARWYQDIQYFAALGATVVAPNFRGSTGNGKDFQSRGEDLAGQVDDILAAVDYARDLEGVDPDHVYLMMGCYGSTIGYRALAESDASFRGLIDWVGKSSAAFTERHAGALPPLLMLTAKRDETAPHRVELARRLSAAGVDVAHHVYDTQRAYLDRESRAAMLDDIAAFFDRHSPRACE